MTTQQLFRAAYSAARQAVQDDNNLHGVYRSPMAAALDATAAGFAHRERFRVAQYAERVALMGRPYRLRRSTMPVTPTRSARLVQQYCSEVR